MHRGKRQRIVPSLTEYLLSIWLDPSTTSYSIEGLYRSASRTPGIRVFFGTLGDDFYKKLNSRSNLALILGVLKQYRSAEESDDPYTMHLWSQIDPIPNVAYKPCLLATTPAGIMSLN
ncbi:hypothetical protein PROFUN_11759 [Planoprotostelium fungivorum]|uniref:Uncharacterized protein n=1 Tax=Planoprotostelium fungivorum TaxID=1890364 RepID=A0A2P6N8L2_9EUKA|nr:hypothetical protein PROFUN_11759 [Planoprotostelium fungivorum]